MEKYIVNKTGRKIALEQIHRLGITSIYAGGKGTVSALFQELGARIIDLDDLAREVVRKGSPVYKQILKYFEERGYPQMDLISADGELNRRWIGKIVFRDAKALEFMNSVTHPAIIQKTEEIMNQVLNRDKKAKFALNIPLLFEANLRHWVDLVIVINTPLEQAIERGARRDNLSREEIIVRVGNQIPLNEKIPLADYVIENKGTIEDLRNQVTSIWRDIQG